LLPFDNCSRRCQSASSPAKQHSKESRLSLDVLLGAAELAQIMSCQRNERNLEIGSPKSLYESKEVSKNLLAFFAKISHNYYKKREILLD